MPLLLAGVRSVTQIRVDANPGRAGSVRTSGDGPSWIAVDRPFSPSIVTRRRTGLTSRAASVIERGAHHDERHEAADPRVGPAVPVAELHDDIARPHGVFAVVEAEHPLAFEDDAIVHRLGLVDRRAV